MCDGPFEGCWVPLEAIESSENLGMKLFQGSEEAVVSRHLLDLLPNVLCCVQVWRIRRQEVNLDKVVFAFEPVSNSRTFVVFRVVCDEVDLSTFVVPDQLIEQSKE